VLLSVAALALFLTVDAAQVTGRGVAVRTLRRAVASLAEVDSLTPAALPEVKRQAASGVSEPLTVPDFPVAVTLDPQEAEDMTPDGLREALVGRSAAAVYRDGVSVFRADGGSGAAGLVSASGAIDNGLDFLREKNHEALRAVVWVLAGVCAALAAAIVALAKGYARLTLIGAALSATGVPLLALAVAVQVVMRVAAGATDDYISLELLQLGQDVFWVPIRNGVAFAGLGLALLLLGLAASSLQSNRRTVRRARETGTT